MVARPVQHSPLAPPSVFPLPLPTVGAASSLQAAPCETFAISTYIFKASTLLEVSDDTPLIV